MSNKVIIAHAGAVLVFHGGGKDVGGGVVSGKASLAHVGAIVADQSINVFSTNLNVLVLSRFRRDWTRGIGDGEVRPGKAWSTGSFLLLVRFSSG